VLVVRYGVGGFTIGHHNPDRVASYRLCSQLAGVEYWTGYEASCMSGIRSTFGSMRSWQPRSCLRPVSSSLSRRWR